MRRIAILASGSGSNFEALAQAAAQGRLAAQIAGVVCNVPGAGVLARAERLGVKRVVLPSAGVKSPGEREAYDARLGDAVDALGADLVVLAGYMRLLSSPFIRRFGGKIVNIHPSLLPAFPGLRVHESVLAHGCKVSGCTVHFVDEGLDSGPILAQAAVPVLEGDTPASLAERVHAAEHQLYPWAVEQIARGRVRFEGRRVVIEGAEPVPPVRLP
jgi:phosphoribosylglycinamide formyltransferase-1